MHELAKAPTGIAGLDEIVEGGLPAGRPTLVCGGPGSGKTLVGVTFLASGARDYGEPGVLMTFEETSEELQTDVASLGVGLADLVADGRIAIDYVHIDPAEIEETGDYDLEALFVRLDHAVRSVGAKRVVLDTIEALFSGLSNEAVLRAELRRLFRWLKDRGLTTVITAERGQAALTRHGLEEYVSDAVILLDHRVTDQISTRRLRVLKYRGSPHGTNEYPFVIDRDGIRVMPVTSMGLDHVASRERISTGIDTLDAMLDGGGFYRGSSVLVSGGAGTGKTSLAGHFAAAACRRGERVLWFLFEESPDQVTRNLQAIGANLEPHVTRGLLEFHAQRPSRAGLEAHLALMFRAVEVARPDVVIVDPVTNLVDVGTAVDVQAMLTRFIDYLKTRGITTLFTTLLRRDGPAFDADARISSLMDSWVLLTLDPEGGRRRRQLAVVKSRGMGHSHDILDFAITKSGVHIRAAHGAGAPGEDPVGAARG
jgi:circadian clock protein KaiC